MRRGPALALVAALSACDGQADIIAYGPGAQLGDEEEGADDEAAAAPEPARRDGGAALRDGGSPPVQVLPEAGLPLDAAAIQGVETDATVPIDPINCADDARYLILIDKAGMLSRLRADSLIVEELGTPDCLTRGVIAAAVDRTGALWVSTQDHQLWWIGPRSTTCAHSNLKVSPGPLTFVYDRATNRELLYFVDTANNLLVLDPESHMQTSVGPLKTPFLVGTGSQGDLLALGELGDTTLSLDSVSLDDAAITPITKVTRKVDQTLMGATGWRGEVALLLRSELYTYSEETGTLSWLAPDPPLAGPYVALASSVCGASPK